jgi:hypothetical protein
LDKSRSPETNSRNEINEIIKESDTFTGRNTE